MNYIINANNKIAIDGEIIVSKDNLVQAIYFCNSAIAKSIERFFNGNLHSNLHQDGYPDLLITNTKERPDYYISLYDNISGKIYHKDKSFFSPFKYGGIKVKATYGVRFLQQLCLNY